MDREIEVVRYICMEYINKEILEWLFISKCMVENYWFCIIEKLGVKNIVGLVVYVIICGIYWFDYEYYFL